MRDRGSGWALFRSYRIANPLQPLQVLLCELAAAESAAISLHSLCVSTTWTMLSTGQSFGDFSEAVGLTFAIWDLRFEGLSLLHKHEAMVTVSSTQFK